MYEQYLEQEILKFKRETRALKDQPLEDRKENGENFTDYLNNHLGRVIESIEWVIQGNYGQGAYLEALRVLKNKRCNRRAWLFNTVAALEWRVDTLRACKVWNALTPETQEKINNELDKVIEEWEAETC